MTTHDMPALDDVAQALAAARLGISASEVHGAMTGYLCAGGAAQQKDWLQTLQLEGIDSHVSTQAQPALAELAAATAHAIQPSIADLQLLLPAQDAAMAQRAGALVDWCRGFLGGFGLAGSGADGLEPGMAQILRDFADIAATDPETGDADEDEAALSELTDHVRFGVLLLHTHLTVPAGTTRQ